MEQATSIGEIGLALSALLVLIYPLAQPVFLMAVMLAVIPAQAGAGTATPPFSRERQPAAEAPPEPPKPHSQAH